MSGADSRSRGGQARAPILALDPFRFASDCVVSFRIVLCSIIKAVRGQDEAVLRRSSSSTATARLSSSICRLIRALRAAVGR